MEVATYLVATGLGGVIGNRSDAPAKRLFEAVVERWRRDQRREALTIDEAVDAAKAAIYAAQRRGIPRTVDVISARRRRNGSWTVRLRVEDSRRRLPVAVVIPEGDPANAKIHITSWCLRVTSWGGLMMRCRIVAICPWVSEAAPPVLRSAPVITIVRRRGVEFPYWLARAVA
ncbi:hypothetical protein ABZ801_24895 [Actinomadura sp. NPDC047616]|uniref:hypothetical protein n=1 Tax=Actinomadura sp. NPDC047616 TaxID=3155914 RepID=UPI00340FFAD9